MPSRIVLVLILIMINSDSLSQIPEQPMARARNQTLSSSIGNSQQLFAKPMLSRVSTTDSIGNGRAVVQVSTHTDSLCSLLGDDAGHRVTPPSQPTVSEDREALPLPPTGPDIDQLIGRPPEVDPSSDLAQVDPPCIVLQPPIVLLPPVNIEQDSSRSQQPGNAGARSDPGKAEAKQEAPSLELVKAKREARWLLEDCSDFVDINGEVPINSVTIELLSRKADSLNAQVNTVSGTLEELGDTSGLVEELLRRKSVIKRFIAASMAKIHIPSPVQAAPPPVAAPTHSDRYRDVSPDRLHFFQLDLEYFVDKLMHVLSSDVAVGTAMSNAKLRELHDVTMPQVAKAIDECRQSLKTYTGVRG